MFILPVYLVYVHLVLPRSTLFIHSFRFLVQPPDYGKWSCWAIQNADLVHPIWGELQPRIKDLGIIVKPSSRWWLNQPIWKYARQIGSCPQVGVNTKKIWNHYLVSLISLPGIWLTETSPTWSCWSFRANNSDLLLETTSWTIWTRPCLAFIPGFVIIINRRISQPIPDLLLISPLIGAFAAVLQLLTLRSETLLKYA